jgi:hypothetical protein
MCIIVGFHAYPQLSQMMATEFVFVSSGCAWSGLAYTLCYGGEVPLPVRGCSLGASCFWDIYSISNEDAISDNGGGDSVVDPPLFMNPNMALSLLWRCQLSMCVQCDTASALCTLLPPTKRRRRRHLHSVAGTAAVCWLLLPLHCILFCTL